MQERAKWTCHKVKAIMTHIVVSGKGYLLRWKGGALSKVWFVMGVVVVMRVFVGSGQQ